MRKPLIVHLPDGTFAPVIDKGYAPNHATFYFLSPSHIRPTFNKAMAIGLRKQAELIKANADRLLSSANDMLTEAQYLDQI